MSLNITPTLASHIIVVYNAMEAESEELDDVRLYKGAISTLIRDLGISMSYYKPIFRALYDFGYCEKIDQGGRNKPSTIILLRKPERDELLDLTSDDEERILSTMNRLETLESSIGGLHIVTALANFERRLIALEESYNGKSKN